MTTKPNNTPATTPVVQADFKTGLVKAQDTYLKMIDDQFSSHGMRMSDYQKTCAMNAIYAIQSVLDKTGGKFSDSDFDQTSLTGILKTTAALELNASATPREVYFSIRKENRKVGNQDNWIKKLEMGIEGDGNDALLRRFGVDVKKVGRPWLVREGDDFTFPTHNGFEVTPPVWVESGNGPIIRVVYPVLLSDGSAEFLIQEREDVRANLLAHLSNNLMNETFGVAESRYKATVEQKKQIDAKKKELLTVAKALAMEGILDNETLQPYISPAWTEPQSREQMIIRKMRNNAVKKYPKDFGSSFVSESYNGMDESFRDAQSEIDANANKELKDITPPEDAAPQIPLIEATVTAEVEQSAKGKTTSVPQTHPQAYQPSFEEPGF